jgi:methionine sulfoxide reductase heme-binding subunit
MPPSLQPWRTRSGDVSALKLLVFIGLFLPALWLLIQAPLGLLGSKPLTSAIHQSGDWAVRFLLLSLAITPLRSIARWNDLILVRRMLGLAALAYVLLHLGLHIWLEAFDLVKVAKEIALRFYLTIGFVALIGLIALGITSTDGMIRRLGSLTWNRLHSTVYALAVLALVHFALQRKIDIYEPTLMAGFFLWLMGFRAMRRFGVKQHWRLLIGLAIVTALATAAVEYLWYATMTGIPAGRVLAANLDFGFTIRPMWWVLAAGLGMAMLGALRGAGSQPRATTLAPSASPTP